MIGRLFQKTIMVCGAKEKTQEGNLVVGVLGLGRVARNMIPDMLSHVYDFWEAVMSLESIAHMFGVLICEPSFLHLLVLYIDMKITLDFRVFCRGLIRKEGNTDVKEELG